MAQVASDAGLPVSAEAVERGQAGAKRDYADWMRLHGSHDAGWFHFVESLLRRAGVPSDRIAGLARTVRAAHDRHNLWRRVPDGLPEALDRLRDAGSRLAVVSNSEGGVEALLARVGLRERFEMVVDSHVEGVSKPDPEIFRRAISRLGVGPERALYVGDIPDVDVVGARAAGVEAVLVDAFDEHPAFDGAARVRSVVELAEAWLSGTSARGNPPR